MIFNLFAVKRAGEDVSAKAFVSYNESSFRLVRPVDELGTVGYAHGDCKAGHLGLVQVIGSITMEA